MEVELPLTLDILRRNEFPKLEMIEFRSFPFSFIMLEREREREREIFYV